jgi:hypothetical protein
MKSVPGSARVSRVGDRVLAITDFFSAALLRERLFRRVAETNTRGPSRTGVARSTQPAVGTIGLKS